MALGEGEPDRLSAERHTQPLGPKQQELEQEQNALGESLFSPLVRVPFLHPNEC